MASAAQITKKPTKKYEKRREEILNIASHIINLHGAPGLSLAEVARALELDTSSVSYYFKRKDLLAAACYERSLAWLRGQAQVAAQQPTVEARIRAFIRPQFDLYLDFRNGDPTTYALLSEMRALDDDIRQPLDADFWELFQIIRDFFADGVQDDVSLSVAAHLVIVNGFWATAWLKDYLDRDLDRALDRLIETLLAGLQPADKDWSLHATNLEHPTLDRNGEAVDDATERFLHAATFLLNDQGYRGASVERIAAHLGVTIGSFYHHLDNKDDLVAACCERSFALIERAQVAAEQDVRHGGDQLGNFIATLLNHQFRGKSSFLRLSAIHSLPDALRLLMFARHDREAMHIASLIADGQRDGSVAMVDPYIAGQTVLATLNAASDLSLWSIAVDTEAMYAIYIRKLLRGIMA